MTRLETRPHMGRLLVQPLVVVALLLGAWLYVKTLDLTLAERVTLRRAPIQADLYQHCKLVFISFAVVVVTGLPLGVVLAKSPSAVRIAVLAIASLGQSVPSIAVLVLAFSVLGLGVLPTIVGLVLYGLLPILRNTVVALDGVDPAATEAARGMGMTPWQSLLRIELPLASPLILAGARTSLVLIVGTATLGNFIGGGGLGDLIAEGIGADFRSGPTIVLVAATITAALALILDWMMGLVARALAPRM